MMTYQSNIKLTNFTAPSLMTDAMEGMCFWLMV